MRKYLPYVLFVFGLGLLAGAAWYGWHTTQAQPAAATAPAASGDAPAALAGATITEKTTGAEAAAQIQGLHLSTLSITDGVVVVYGTQQAVVWIAETDSGEAAAALLADMSNSIAKGSSQFTAASILNFSGRDVYEVTGLEQLHFYFQSGAKVIWLSANQGVAEQALIELMKFYP